MSPLHCKQTPGTFQPRIDRNRCEGKGPCVPICPVGVLAVQTLGPDQRQGLSIKGKVKGFVHRWQQAVVVKPQACEGCGLCVSACPEKAITLVRKPMT